MAKSAIAISGPTHSTDNEPAFGSLMLEFDLNKRAPSAILSFQACQPLIAPTKQIWAAARKVVLRILKHSRQPVPICARYRWPRFGLITVSAQKRIV